MGAIQSIVYSCALNVLGYTYLGYPILITIKSKCRPRQLQKDKIEPSVSVVMAVYNEARWIDKKIRNLLSLEYPREKVQIVVVSDASDDETDAIVRRYTGDGVVFKRLEVRSGKPTALNLGVSHATGDIVIFCDARQRIDIDAFRELVSCFVDPSVGAVSGELFIDSEKGPGLYWKYEKMIRAAESLVDSVPGATGALYAIRRELYEQLPKDLLLDDVYTPMQIILKGYRVVFEPNAKVYDVEADHSSEWRRKARTLAGNFQLLHYLPEILNPKKNRIFWQFASHKLMRLACPWALGGLFLSNIALVVSGAPGRIFYLSTLAAQCAGYGLALNGMLKKEKAGSLSRAAYTFVLLNAAAVEGARRYLKKDYAWTH